MKIVFVRIVLGFSTVLFTYMALEYDNMKYGYGHGCTFCSTRLPYGVVPRYEFEYPQSFALIYDDFKLVGKGFKYKRSDSMIDELIGYGYNDTSILVEYIDKDNIVHYLSSYETSYTNHKGNIEISFEEISQIDFEQQVKAIRWVTLGEDNADIVFVKWLVFGIASIASFFLLLWNVIGNRFSKS